MVALDIYFNYKGDESKRATVLARLSKARECAIDFFARHGLTLEPVFQVDSGLPDRMNSGSTVNLWDKFERSYSSNWGMLENQGRSKSEASICGLVVHELSHHLGLPDTYPDPDCPTKDLSVHWMMS